MMDGFRVAPSHSDLGMSGNSDFDDDSDVMFHVEPLEWRPKPAQGRLTCLDVGSNVLLLSTENSFIIRWNVETDAFEEIQVSKKPDEKIHKVFINSTGVHAIIGMKNGNNYYIHTKKNRPILMKKVTGIVLESVAWNGPMETDNNTKQILLGTSQGKIYETLIEDSKDKYLTKIYDVKESTDKHVSPVSGIHIEQFPPTEPNAPPKWFVMVATPTRFFQVIGGPTFEEMFKKYAFFVELPTDLSYSQLAYYSKFQGQTDEHCAVDAVAWLTGPGIYHGSLVFGSQSQPGDQVVSYGALLAYDELKLVPTEGKDAVKMPKPVALVRTQFHFLLLTAHRLVAVNQLSQQVVFDRSFDPKYGEMRGLVCDGRMEAVFMFSDTHVFEIEIENEDRDVWRLYLQQNKFAQALEHCLTQQQMDTVFNAQADHHFEQGAYELAATIYAKTQRSFEEVTLKFVFTGAHARNALKTFLLKKLTNLSPEDATQQAMVCTWLTEIFLDNLNALEEVATGPMEGPDVASQRASAQRELDDELSVFRDFLESYEDVLRDLRTTTFDLISSHGRTKELLFYATLIGDLEWVLNHHIGNKDYRSCVQLLAGIKDPVKHSDLFYKFAPVLLQHVPSVTVDLLCVHKKLEASKFIPALMRYETMRREMKAQDDDEAVRYLEHCIFRMRNSDPAIHNFLVSLYVQQDDPQETKLLSFIKRFRDRPVYDRKYALRLCHQNNKRMACVAIYAVMNRFDEAVKLALEVDVTEAKLIVGQCIKVDERKKLWLRIARHVIEKERNIETAIGILKECQDYLTLEDILPYFPDFVKIGDFKKEICTSLETYNKNIDQLKTTMDSYTQSAVHVRRQISQLKKRSAKMRYNQRCDSCTRPVLTRQFLVFPCTHVFHADCATNLCEEYLERNPRLKANVWREFSTPQDRDDMAPIKAYAASECSLCGDILIESVQRPFITPHVENDELKSWEI